MLNGSPDFERINKAEINLLPIRSYDGPVSVVHDQEGLTKALKALAAESVLGFDTETRPAFNKGERHAPAVLQLAGASGVFVFQLTVLGFPEELRAVLADTERLKAGVALDHDVRMLQILEAFEPAGFIDLGTLAKNAGLKNFGLRGLAAALLGVRISKKARLSNWAVKRLTPDQITYAATDAWIGRELYLRFEKSGLADSAIPDYGSDAS
jgi:ribonuclease D